MRQLGTVASSVASVLHASHSAIAACSIASRKVSITCVLAIVVSRLSGWDDRAWPTLQPGCSQAASVE
jgi:hypothetical protein